MTRHASRQPRPMGLTAPRGARGHQALRLPHRTVGTGASNDRNKSADKAEGPAVSMERRDRADLKPPRPRLRVVIVEDEAIISLELEMLLEELEAEVVGAAMSAAEAEALVAAHRPDCVTMDISLKGAVDGVTAARVLFERYGVRSIFVSAYVDAEQKARAEAANPLGWIRKPFEKADLEEVLRSANLRDV